jgi:cellulase/cellobiase CelA1
MRDIVAVAANNSHNNNNGNFSIGRDCAALASNGEIASGPAGIETYKTKYIDVLFEEFSTKKDNVRLVLIMEPDSLRKKIILFWLKKLKLTTFIANLLTNINQEKCSKAADGYREGVAYALSKLAAIPNVYMYLDVSCFFFLHIRNLLFFFFLDCTWWMAWLAHKHERNRTHHGLCDC